MPKLATDKIRRVGDECFLPLDEEMLAYLDALGRGEAMLTVQDNCVVVTTPDSE